MWDGKLLLLACGLAALTAWLAVRFYLKVPSHWLCEYDEIPGGMHMPGIRCMHERRTTVFSAILLIPVWYFRWQGTMLTRWGAILQPEQDTRWRYGETAGALAGGMTHMAVILSEMLVMMLLLTAAYSDLDYRIIPDPVSGLLLLMAGLRVLIIRPGLAAATWSFSAGSPPGRALWHVLLDAIREDSLNGLKGGALAGGIMLGSAVFSTLMTGTEAMGFGDIKLMTVCGMLVGVEWSVTMYILMVLSSAVFFAGSMLAGRCRAGEAQPLAPWIAASAIVCLTAEL